MAYKMKGFGGFKSSPNKQKIDPKTKLELPKNKADRKIMQDELSSLSPEGRKYVMEQQSKVKPVVVKKTVEVPAYSDYGKLTPIKPKKKSPAKQAGVINMDLLHKIGHQLGSTTKEGKSTKLTDYGKMISALGPGLEGIMKDMKDIKEQKRKDALEQQNAEEIKKKSGNNDDSSNGDSSNGDSSNGDSGGKESGAKYKTPYKMKYSKRNFPFK
jgi:hypothetical protein